jgi:hypothetical protein
MFIAFVTTIVAFTALCIGLGVRIINRRERWAKWTALALIAVAMYPASFGPACWIHHATGIGGPALARIYAPVGPPVRACSPNWRQYPGSAGPTDFQRRVSRLIEKYANFRTGDVLIDWDEDEGPIWASRL